MLHKVQIGLIVLTVFFHSCGQQDLSKNQPEVAHGMAELTAWGEADVAVEHASPSIWDITKRHNSFSTFSLLLEAAGLDKTLRSDQQITVLAPTEEAFQQLGEGSLIELLKEDNRWILEELLLNHVIPDVHPASELLHGETRPTLSGRRLEISRDSKLKLSNATVTTADITARNGIVHVVDQVILVY
jgi:uncharacterized surface protein with fasciclin (FAS1) repeats